MELLATPNNIAVYDDFAHHPTAIETTLKGLRAKVGNGKIIVVLEPRSNTMKSGVHKDTLASSMALANEAWLYQASNVGWDIADNMRSATIPVTVSDDISHIVTKVSQAAHPGDTIVVMSNGGFNGIHQQIIQALLSQ
jgi:UDP-N-acetylmuramate: L-alanyl-gamma-D-glutamyl-meso-diaminopimelate ligase